MISIPPLVLIALVYIFGIIIGAHLSYPFPIITSLLLVSFVLVGISFFKKYSKIRLLGFFASLLLFSIFYTNNYFRITSSNIEGLKNKSVILTGAVVSEPDIRNWQTNLIVRAEKIELSAAKEIQPKEYKVLIRIRFQKKDILYGEKYKFSGVLRIPDREEFASYLKRQNISATMNIGSREKIQYIGEGKENLLIKYALKVKKELVDEVKNYVSPVYFPILGEMMLKAGIIPNQIIEMFTKIGIVHILSISGLHVVMIGGIFLIIFRLFNIPKRISYSIVFVLIIIYALIAGLGAPIVRSALMINLFFLGYIIRRRTNIFITLSTASLLILLWNPYSLFDIGFQLSFITILGMVLVTPKLEKLFKLRPIWPVRIFLISIAAWLSSLPLVAYYFGYISWISPISNLIVIPLATVILACGFLLLISVWVLPFLSYFLGAVINFLVFLLLKISEIISSWPFAYSEFPADVTSGIVPFDLTIVVIYYLAVLVFLFYPEFKELLKGFIHVR